MSDRQKKFETEMAEKKGASEAQPEDDDNKKEAFDFNKFKADFDAANPEIEIAEEVASEIDNDFDLPYKPPVVNDE